MTPAERPGKFPLVDARARPRSWQFLLVVLGLSICAGWTGRRLQDSHATDPDPSQPPAADSGSLAMALGNGEVLDPVHTPEQRQLADIGFEIERQPFMAPQLTIEDSRGVSRSLSDLQGAWVILEFWSVSCEPCRAAMPALQRFSAAEAAKRLAVIPVCVDADDAQAAQDLISQFAPGLTTYVDSAGIGIAQFDVQALPATWLIDPAGQVYATKTGRIDWDSAPVRSAFENLTRHDESQKNF